MVEFFPGVLRIIGRTINVGQAMLCLIALNRFLATLPIKRASVQHSSD